MLSEIGVGRSWLPSATLNSDFSVARVPTAPKAVRTVMLALVVGLMTALTSSLAHSQLRQDKLYIDDGTGLFTIIKSLSLSSGNQTIKFPNLNGASDGQIVIMQNPLSPVNAWQIGDLAYASATGNSLTRLAHGNNGDVLKMVGGLPTWSSAGGSGSVTSVDMTVPSFLSVSGGPITTNGTLAVSLSNQSGNTVFSSPSDGSSGPPTFRTLVPSDIPNLPASQITSGVLSVAQGGTGQSTLAAALIALLPDTTGQTDRYLHVVPGGGFDWNTPSVGGGGSVTSVAASGGTTGLSFTGAPITTSGTLTLTGTLGIANGGTGQTTAAGALNALLPDSTGQTGKILSVTPGGGYSWSANGGTVTNNVTSPAALVGNTNNYVIGASDAYIRLNNTSAGSIDLTGIDNTNVANGRVVTLTNISSNAIVIRHHSGLSTAGNQFDLPGAADIILGPRGTATFTYDQTAGYWNLTSTN